MGMGGAGPSTARSPGDGVGGFAVPSSPTSPSSPMQPGILPPLTPQDRAKFVGIFYNSGPENGVLDGMYTWIAVPPRTTF